MLPSDRGHQKTARRSSHKVQRAGRQAERVFRQIFVSNVQRPTAQATKKNSIMKPPPLNYTQDLSLLDAR